MAETLRFSEDQIQAITKWKQGDHYVLEIVAEQVTPTTDGEAAFEPVRVTGREAEEGEVPASTTTEEDRSFREELEKTEEQMETSVLEPSTGPGSDPEQTTDSVNEDSTY